MINRHEAFIVAKLDRDAARTAERERITTEAQAAVAAFMARFANPAERVIAADALARAVAPVVTRLTGATVATMRFGAASGRAEVLPDTAFRGRRP